MSLLMEALRKAEEAKRLSAQNEKDQQQSSEKVVEAIVVSNPIAEPVPEKDVPAVEWTLDEKSEETPPPVLTDDKEKDALDIEYDFGLDESFGLPQENNQVNDIVDNTDIITDPVQLSPERESKHASNNHESFASVADSAGEESIIDDHIVAFETASGASLDSPPVDAVVAASKPLAVRKPAEPVIKAQRTEDDEIFTELKANNEAIAKKTSESLRRESARAVFTAKTANNRKPRNGRLIALVALLALIPLGAGVYYLLQQMGMFSSTSRFDIPVAQFDSADVQPFDADYENSADGSDASLPDVSLQQNDDTNPFFSSEIDNGDSTSSDNPIAVQSFPQADLAADVVSAPVENTLTAPEVTDNTQQTTPDQGPAPTAAPASQPITATVAEAAPVIEPQSVNIAAAAPPASNPINITRNDTQAELDPQITKAYDAYRGGDLLTARASYQQALRNEPNNRDAMLGLAAVAGQMNDSAQARAIYSRLLQLDPTDALARIGLMQATPTADAVQFESNLKGLFAENPDVAQLAFSLGNLYASQGRWNKAQQSYYDAFLAAKANGVATPDYPFNLAVSLERLNQLRPAYNFYREALEMSKNMPAAFDLRVLRERLDAIERVLP